MFDLAKGQAIITLLGAFPGYFFTVGLVERMGRLRIQVGHEGGLEGGGVLAE